MQILRGSQLWVNLGLLSVSLLLSALESSIIATALVSISQSFGALDRTSWVVVSYLLTYTAFLVVFARLSDIFGRKLMLLTTLAIFVIFSLACGFSHSLVQLIIFRALQGIGGSGLYGLVFAIYPEIVPPEQFGAISGVISAVFAVSSIIGPLIGGGISTHTTWRWVFWLNVPAGVVVGLGLIFFFPNDTPSSTSLLRRLGHIDLPGTFLLLAGSILLVFAIQQGGTAYPWSSAAIISTLVLGAVCWLLFAAWEHSITLRRARSSKSNIYPTFPTTLARHRVVGTAMLSAFLLGFPFQTTIVYLPTRFQLENGLSPVAAGVRMLPLLLVCAVFTGIAGATCSRKNVSCWMLVGGSALQVLGLGLLSSVPAGASVSARQYGFQAILGTGFGLAIPTLIIITRVEVEFRDLAVTMGAINQARVFGGVLGVAVAQGVISARLRSGLQGVVSAMDVTRILASPGAVRELPPVLAERVRAVYGEAFAAQVRVVLYVSAAAVVVSLGTIRWRARDLREVVREHEVAALALREAREGERRAKGKGVDKELEGGLDGEKGGTVKMVEV